MSKVMFNHLFVVVRKSDLFFVRVVGYIHRIRYNPL